MCVQVTGQSVLFVTYSQLRARFTECKELSGRKYEPSVPQRDTVGKVHFSQPLPNRLSFTEPSDPVNLNIKMPSQ